MSPLPSLDERCSEFFVYRDLIECGETWQRLTREKGQPFDNTPRVPETFEAIRALCAVVLDPVVRRFGTADLTYGFASSRLTRCIPRRIHPAGDQHAGHELGRRGQPICHRGGLAVDFAVRGVDSLELARWVVEHAAFDRLYFYGRDRPIHVSAGPESTRQIVVMRPAGPERLIPRVVREAVFLTEE